MKRINASDLKNDFESLITVLTPFVDEVEVSEPLGDDASETVATYKLSEWKKGIHRVGNGFYGVDDLIELSPKYKVNEYGKPIGAMFDIFSIQLRRVLSSGYGTMYRDKPIGSIIVEVCANNRWKDYDMRKENDKIALADYLNSLA